MSVAFIIARSARLVAAGYRLTKLLFAVTMQNLLSICLSLTELAMPKSRIVSKLSMHYLQAKASINLLLKRKTDTALTFPETD
jgi:hypothetical protein